MRPLPYGKIMIGVGSLLATPPKKEGPFAGGERHSSEMPAYIGPQLKLGIRPRRALIAAPPRSREKPAAKALGKALAAFRLVAFGP